MKSIEFKRRIMYLFIDSLFDENLSNSGYVTGISKVNSFDYDVKKLGQHGIEIVNLLSEIGIFSSKKMFFNDMKKDINGNEWTSMNFYVDILLSLANALRILEFEKAKEDWTKYDKENPEIFCSIK